MVAKCALFQLHMTFQIYQKKLLFIHTSDSNTCDAAVHGSELSQQLYNTIQRGIRIQFAVNFLLQCCRYITSCSICILLGRIFLYEVPFRAQMQTHMARLQEHG